MPDIDGTVRCSWCEDTLYPDDPDFTDCQFTGEAHYDCHEDRCYCADLRAAGA